MKRNTSKILVLAMIGSMLYSVNSMELVQVKAENGVTIESQIIEKELVIQDSSFSLDTIVEKELKDATVIKLSNSNVSVGKLVLPKQVTQLLGWKAKNILDPVEEEMVRYLGSKVNNQTFSFEVGSQTKIKNIHFEQGVSIQIPENVTVTFENCTFQGKVENKGNSKFIDCTFIQEEMVNTGIVEFLGTTKAPNTVSFDNNNPFTLEVEKERMADGKKNTPYQETITYQITGMKEEDVTLEVSISPAYMGVTAVAKDGILTVSGTPKEAGTIQITLTGKAKSGSDEVTKQILLVIQESNTSIETGVVPSKPEENNTSSTGSSSSSSTTGNSGTSSSVGGGSAVTPPPSNSSGTQPDAVSGATSNTHNTTNGSTSNTQQNNSGTNQSSNETSQSNTVSNTSGGGSMVTTPPSSSSNTQPDAVSSASTNVHKTEQGVEDKKKKETKKQKGNNKKVGKKEKAQNKQSNEGKDICYKKAKGTTFIKALKSLNVDVSFQNRKKIAEANGIKNYKGTSKQNAKLLELAKNGKLKQPKSIVNKK